MGFSYFLGVSEVVRPFLCVSWSYVKVKYQGYIFQKNAITGALFSTNTDFLTF